MWFWILVVCVACWFAYRAGRKSTISGRTDPPNYRFGGKAYPQYRITYADADGVLTERDIYINKSTQRGGVVYHEAWCFARDERRTFREDRIMERVTL